MDPENKITRESILHGCKTDDNHIGETKQRISKINRELRTGITFIENFNHSVTIFGSARFKEGNQYYDLAQAITKRIVKDTGYAVVTGGGPGIMEAANRGATIADGSSIGFTIKLPNEQITNPYVTDELLFRYFFTRKVVLSYSAEVYIYFPGGFGTLDELFEILTLIQTGMIDRVPVILVGADFWNPLVSFIKNKMLDQEKTISPEDMDFFTVTDDVNEIIKIVKEAPVRESA